MNLRSAFLAFLALTVPTSAQIASKAPSSADLAGYRPAFLDRSISPCQDFYHFAVGSWLKQAPNLIRPDQAAVGYDQDLLARQEPVLRAILTDTNRPRTPEASLVRTFYASVLHGPRGEGVAPIRHLLARIAKAHSLEDQAEILGWLHRSGINALWVWRVRPDELDSRNTWLRLERGWTGMPGATSYTASDAESISLREAYVMHLVQTLGQAGFDTQTAKAGAGAIVVLETQIARTEATIQDEMAARHSQVSMTLAGLAKAFPRFPWQAYFRGLGLTNPGRVWVPAANVVEIATQWLAQSSSNQIQAYFTVCLLKEVGPYLDTPIRTAHQAFWGKRLQGLTGTSATEQEGLDLTRNLLGMPLGREYVRRTFTEKTRKRVHLMVEDLRGAFMERIQVSEWLSPNAKQSALAKARAFRAEIGCPPRWPSIQGLVIDAGKPLVSNVLAALSFRARTMLAQAGKPTDPFDWGYYTPLPPSAMVDKRRCKIVIPAGIIQPPFFHPEASDAANYGGLGCVLGHEIGHLFDEEGRHFDAQGRMVNGWNAEDERRYRMRADRLVAQINTYEVLPGLHADGEKTLAEAMADQVGVQMCFDAYCRRMRGRSEALDAQGFSSDQRFFLSYAESYRRWERPETMRENLRWEDHPPVEFSVNGPLANLNGFHRAFGCNSGSSMYRADALRPSLW